MNGDNKTSATPFFYIQRILGFILLLSLAAVFLFSGISKLYAFEQFLWNVMDVGISNMMLAGIIARLFIGLELLLGAFLALHIYLKSFTYPAVMALLIFFSIYLMFLIHTQGDSGNCGCFGEAYQMKPSAGIIKNIILLGITAILWVIYPVKSYKGSLYIGSFLVMIGLVLPFILFPLSKQSQPKIVHEPIDLNALYEGNAQPDVELRTGKHIIAFMSLSCPHCQKAGFIFHIIHKQHPEIPIFLVLHGSKEFEKDFYEASKAQQVPQMRFDNTEAFIHYAHDGVPAIYWINNGVIERDANYFQLDPQNMKEWLSEK